MRDDDAPVRGLDLDDEARHRVTACSAEGGCHEHSDRHGQRSDRNPEAHGSPARVACERVDRIGGRWMGAIFVSNSLISNAWFFWHAREVLPRVARRPPDVHVDDARGLSQADVLRKR